MIRTSIALVLVGVSGALGAANAATPQVPSPLLPVAGELYVNLTLIDGRDGPPRPSSAIYVVNGRIRAVGLRGSMGLPEGTRVVDLGGAFVTPGFIDAHASPESQEDLTRLFAAGITGVRDGSVSPETFRERGRGSFGRDPRPKLYIGGPLLGTGAASGGAGVVLQSEEHATAAVQSQIEDGAPFVSVASGVPARWLVPMARASRRAGAPMWADRMGEGWVLALRAGVEVAGPLVSGDPELLASEDREGWPPPGTSPSGLGAAWLEHLDPSGTEVTRAVNAALSSDAAIMPLLVRAASLLSCESEGTIECTSGSANARARIHAAWPKAEALVRTLHENGVRLIVGSDAPRSGLWGLGFHREMQLLVDAGIPPLDVLSMATRNSAIALGQLHERGTLEAGKRADFLVLEHDPVADIGNAAMVGMVVLEGRAWSRDERGEWVRLRSRTRNRTG